MNFKNVIIFTALHILIGIVTVVFFLLNDEWAQLIGETDENKYPGVLWLEDNHIQKKDYWQKLNGNR